MKYLFAAFLLIAALVHVYGLAFNDTSESTLSHIVHLASYLVALFTIVNPFKYNAVVYFLAAVYPFYYHFVCAINTYYNSGELSAICILVVILMPLIGFWLFNKAKI